MKIYVASSWRNAFQPEVVTMLREAGHEVYDFKNPEHNGGVGFGWGALDEDWENWSTEKFIDMLQHPVAQAGFKSDFEAMDWADACVLAMPCGRSAHLEAGWMVGQGKPTAVYLTQAEPELMYLMCDRLLTTTHELITWAGAVNEMLYGKTGSW